MMGNLARALDERHKVMHSSGEHVTLFLVFSLYAVKVRRLQRGLQRDVNKSKKNLCKVEFEFEFEYRFVQEFYWWLIIHWLKIVESESKSNLAELGSVSRSSR